MLGAQRAGCHVDMGVTEFQGKHTNPSTAAALLRETSSPSGQPGSKGQPGCGRFLWGPLGPPAEGAARAHASSVAGSSWGASSPLNMRLLSFSPFPGGLSPPNEDDEAQEGIPDNTAVGVGKGGMEGRRGI